MPEGKHTRHRGDGEEIPKYGVLEQDVDATLHAITKLMPACHSIHNRTSLFGLFRQRFQDSVSASAAPEFHRREYGHS